MMIPTTHEFLELGTDKVYDLIQCEEIYKDGDVIVIHSEKVVAIVTGAWPCAITSRFGNFHKVKDWPSYRSLYEDYPESIKRARRICSENVWMPIFPKANPNSEKPYQKLRNW